MLVSKQEKRLGHINVTFDVPSLACFKRSFNEDFVKSDAIFFKLTFNPISLLLFGANKSCNHKFRIVQCAFDQRNLWNLLFCLFLGSFSRGSVLKCKKCCQTDKEIHLLKCNFLSSQLNSYPDSRVGHQTTNASIGNKHFFTK